MGRCVARKNVPTATETASHAIRLKEEEGFGMCVSPPTCVFVLHESFISELPGLTKFY
jgi:hypothetical protein